MPTSDLGELKVGINFDSSGLTGSLKEIEKGMKVVESYTRATASSFELMGNTSDALRSKIDGLNTRITLQRDKIEQLRSAHQASAEATGEDSVQTQNLAIRLNNAISSLNSMEGELRDNEAELRRHESTLRKVSEATKNFGESASKVGEGMQNVGSRLSLGLTAPLVAFGAYAIKTASDLNEVQNVVDTTFGSSAKEIDAWSKSAMGSFGLTELQAKQMTGSLGAMLKSMGLTSDQVVDMSEKMVGLGGDFASFYNLPTEEAFGKIRAGISGETEPLKALGINMSVANLEAYALAEGISKPYKEMSQSEQTMLRYNYLLKVSKDAQGDFSKTSDGTANQMRILQGQFTSLAGELGEKLLPYMNQALQIVSGLLDKFGALSETQKDLVVGIGAFLALIGPVVYVLGSVVKFVGMISSGISWLSVAMAEGGVLYPAITAISGAFTALAGAIGISVGWLVAIVVAVVALIAILVIYRKEIADWIVGVWGAITKFFSDVWTAMPAFFADLWKSITAFFNTLPERLAYWFGFILGSIARFFINAWNSMIEFLKKIPSFIESAGKFFEGLPSRIWTSLVAVVTNIGKWISNMASAVAERVPKVVDSVGEFFTKLPDRMLSIGKNIVDGLLQGIKNAWSNMTGTVGRMVDGFVSGIKKGLGISSPSKLFADEVGAMIPAGISVGIDANTDQVQESLKSITKLASGMAVDYSQGLNAMNSGSNGYITNSTKNDNSFTLIIENFQNNRQQDIENLVEEIDFYRKRMSLATGGAM